MKTTFSNIPLTIFFLAIFSISFAQDNTPKTNSPKKSITVLNIDTKGLALDPAQMGNLVRIELEKLDQYQVMDRYDVAYVVEKNKLDISNCYGKLCLVEIGNVIKTEKMLTGSVDLYGETIIVTLRLLDVPSATIEKTYVMEFLNLPKELQSMINISMRGMFGLKNDEVTVTRLTKKFNYESSTNNPEQERLNLSGPRMGFTAYTGKTAGYIRAEKDQGGYDAFPLMFQFGYQFEQQYLNEGNFQALFEFVPMVTGLDQGLFIPSLTVMNGLRNNKNGYEFAFGPTFSVVKKAKGFYDANGSWHRESEWDAANPDRPTMESRLDSRGDAAISTGFVFAFGKTIKSGKLNIPVNAYVIPHKDGLRLGASFGFNAKRNPKHY